MRHIPRRVDHARHSPSTIDRISDAVATGQKIYGIASAVYGAATVAARVAAPYVAAGIAAI